MTAPHGYMASDIKRDNWNGAVAIINQIIPSKYVPGLGPGGNTLSCWFITLHFLVRAVRTVVILRSSIHRQT